MTNILTERTRKDQVMMYHGTCRSNSEFAQ